MKMCSSETGTWEKSKHPVIQNGYDICTYFTAVLYIAFLSTPMTEYSVYKESYNLKSTGAWVLLTIYEKTFNSVKLTRPVNYDEADDNVDNNNNNSIQFLFIYVQT
jgi:hypothetical protein